MRADGCVVVLVVVLVGRVGLLGLVVGRMVVAGSHGGQRRQRVTGGGRRCGRDAAGGVGRRRLTRTRGIEGRVGGRARAVNRTVLIEECTNGSFQAERISQYRL